MSEESYYQKVTNLYRKGFEDEDIEFDWSLGSTKDASQFEVYIFEEEYIICRGSMEKEKRMKPFRDFQSLHEYLSKNLFEIINNELIGYFYDDEKHNRLLLDETEKEKAPTPTRKFIKLLIHPKLLFDFISKGGGIIHSPWCKYDRDFFQTIKVYKIK